MKNDLLSLISMYKILLVIKLGCFCVLYLYDIEKIYICTGRPSAS